MPQVVISPHMAGDVIGWREAVVDRFLENLERWRSGRPLLHVVDKRRNALSLPVGQL
jgi:phosphoglycerate dehydrogenase-like enzyme